MSFSPLVVSLPIADRRTSYEFYRDGLGLETIGEPAVRTVPGTIASRAAVADRGRKAAIATTEGIPAIGTIRGTVVVAPPAKSVGRCPSVTGWPSVPGPGPIGQRIPPADST